MKKRRTKQKKPSVKVVVYLQEVDGIAIGPKHEIAKWNFSDWDLAENFAEQLMYEGDAWVAGE